jgi:hypothetical protein
MYSSQYLPILLPFPQCSMQAKNYGTRSSIGVSLFGVLTPVASSCGYDTSGQQFL